jgi:Flp pilus assembly protein TadB
MVTLHRPRRNGSGGSTRIGPVHLPRPPSVDHGVVSFLWAFGLGVLLWGFLLAIGMSKPSAFIVAVVAACVIFVYVRLYGEDEPRRRTPR